MTDQPIEMCAIVPAWNEAANLPGVIADLRRHQPDMQIVIVNDCSTDNTAVVAARFGVTVLNLPINLGIGGAVQTGLKYARDNGCDLAIQFDGDGQHLASQIEKIITPVLGGEADVVIGSRFLGESEYQSSFARRTGIRVLQWLNSMMVGSRITDNTSGFRAFNRAAIEFLADYYSQDYPEPQAVIELYRNKFRLLEVPVVMAQRTHGTSSIPSHRSLYYMLKVIMANTIAFTRKPVARKDQTSI